MSVVYLINVGTTPVVFGDWAPVRNFYKTFIEIEWMTYNLLSFKMNWCRLNVSALQFGVDDNHFHVDVEYIVEKAITSDVSDEKWTFQYCRVSQNTLLIVKCCDQQCRSLMRSKLTTLLKARYLPFPILIWHNEDGPVVPEIISNLYQRFAIDKLSPNSMVHYTFCQSLIFAISDSEKAAKSTSLQ